MSAILFAIAAAVGWGASDFFGGESSDRTAVFSVVAITELLGAVLVVPFLIADGVPHLGGRLLLAIVSGLSVTLELSIIYRALSVGAAFITAPVGALGAAIAVSAGIIGGDRVTVPIALALCCAILGGGISAAGDAPDPRRSSLSKAIGACVVAAGAVAVTQITLHSAAEINPYWATAIEHVSTSLTAGVLAAAVAIRAHGDAPVAERIRALPARTELGVLALVGVAGVGGDLAFAAASHGPLSSVSAVSSLYPVPTIALAAAIQGRRPTPVQAVGIVLALSGALLLGALAS